MSTGFNLGAPQPLNLASTAPTLGTTSFAPAQNFNTGTTAPQFNIGIPSTAGTVGTTFPSSTLPSFGTQPASNLFGAKTNTPAFGSLTSAPQPASTGISLPFTSPAKTTASLFGRITPSATTVVAPSGLTFSSSAAPTSTLFSPSVVPISSVPPGSLSFSTPPAGFNLNVPPTTAWAGTLNLSVPTNLFSNTLTTTPLSVPSFQAGVSTAPNTSAASTGGQTSALSFATPSTAPGTLFISSATTTSASQPTFSLQTTSAPSSLMFSSFTSTPSSTAPITAPLASFNVPKTTASLNFNLGTSATSTVPSFGLSSLTTTTSTTTTTPLTGLSLGFNLPKLPGLTTTTQATTTTPSVGLGGISAAPPKQLSSLTTAVEIAPREQALPNELLQTVENFKKFLQEQKSYVNEIARFSTKDLKKVETDTDAVNKKIGELENELRRNKIAAEKLKVRTSDALKHAEMAQRTYEIPTGLQYDNTTPLNYFMELADNFERQMHVLKLGIDDIDKSVTSTKHRSALTSQDLSMGMRRLHEAFISLAGRMQSLHSQVEVQKEQYLQLRKMVLKDHTNVFENRSKELEALEFVLDNITNQANNLTGPTPFNSLGSSHAQTLAQIPANPPPAYPGMTPGGSSTSIGLSKPNTMPLFGNSLGSLSTANISNPASYSMFQLQKPPVGNKRGKS